MHLIAKFGLESGRVRSIKIIFYVSPYMYTSILFIIKQVAFREGMDITHEGT